MNVDRRLHRRWAFYHYRVERKSDRIRRVKRGQSVAEKLSQAGFGWAVPSQTDSTGLVIFTADAYPPDGRRFIVVSDEKLSAFLEFERVTGVVLGGKLKG